MRCVSVDFKPEGATTNYSQWYDYLVPDYITDEDLKNAKLGIVENTFYKGDAEKEPRFKQVRIRNHRTVETSKATKFLVDVIREKPYEAERAKREKAVRAECDAKNWIDSLSSEELIRLFVQETQKREAKKNVSAGKINETIMENVLKNILEDAYIWHPEKEQDIKKAYMKFH